MLVTLSSTRQWLEKIEAAVNVAHAGVQWCHCWFIVPACVTCVCAERDVALRETQQRADSGVAARACVVGLCVITECPLSPFPFQMPPRPLQRSVLQARSWQMLGGACLV